MHDGVMHYRPAILGGELRHTTLAVAWRAADIYALEPASVDAIAEAGADLSLTVPTADVAVLVAVVNDAACHLANTRLTGTARPADPIRWAHWQASATELWPILADAAYLAYRHRIPAGHQPGRYELSTPGAQ
jgi:hypothetical protein